MPRIAVAGPSKAVTDAAMAVTELGGSVVDASIVAALTAMCTEPGVCGPGGGGFLTIDVPGHDPVVIDGYMTQPGLGFSGEPKIREVKMAYGGGLTTLIDAGSIAVPGAFAGLALASEMFGRVPWKTLMHIVADHVDGFPLSSAVHLYLSAGGAQIYQTDPAASTALLSDGTPKAPGEPITFDGLSDTLRHIGDEGVMTLYRGDLGRLIVEDLESRGGQLTMEDLDSYRGVVRKPETLELGEWLIATNPSPAVGGVVLTDALARWPDVGIDDALVEAFQRRFDGCAGSPSTISVAAADDEGGASAASFSAGYGSGIIPKGTGLLMNNALGELELATSEGAGVGERLTSNMAPTVAKRHGQIVALGSPGADRITSALAVTLAQLAEGRSLEAAISHPRVHPEFGDFGVRLAAEPDAEISGTELDVRRFDTLHMYFGGVNAAACVGGELRACADVRRTGAIASSTL